MSATREQTAPQLNTQAAPAPGLVGAVSLATLLARARRRGMANLPPYLVVGLVQQLCRALEQVHGLGAAALGEVSLETVQVCFDGRVRPTAFGDPGRDVAGAALVLDQLLGDTLDPELTRIIGDARQRDPSITTALALEQRLAHWQVKQRQLFPGKDLTRALAGWLFPEQARGAPDPELQEWLEALRTGPVVEEPEAPIEIAPSPPRSWRRVVVVALVLAAGLLLALMLHSATLKRDEPIPAVPATSSAPPVALAPVTRVVAPPAPAEPTLPRTATGAPATIELSSEVHGVRLESSGFPITAPSAHWAVKVVAQQGKAQPPRYGSLFVVELGARGVARLSRVGPTDWLVLRSPEARLFLMQPDQPPDDGSFSIAVATASSEGLTQTELRENVLTDAMTQLEYSRFVLDGLQVAQQYEVTQRLPVRGSAPPVIAIATIPNVHTRDLRGAGFTQTGAPLDQVLLSPGTPVRVSGVSRLSFVVLTTGGAPEALSTIDVVLRGPAPAPPTPTNAPSLVESCRRAALPGFDCDSLGQPPRGKR